MVRLDRLEVSGNWAWVGFGVWLCIWCENPREELGLGKLGVDFFSHSLLVTLVFQNLRRLEEIKWIFWYSVAVLLYFYVLIQDFKSCALIYSFDRYCCDASSYLLWLLTNYTFLFHVIRRCAHVQFFCRWREGGKGEGRNADRSFLFFFNDVSIRPPSKEFPPDCFYNVFWRLKKRKRNPIKKKSICLFFFNKGWDMSWSIYLFWPWRGIRFLFSEEETLTTQNERENHCYYLYQTSLLSLLICTHFFPCPPYELINTAMFYETRWPVV